MATRPEEGSRLWRGMRALIFGEDNEPSLREEIEAAIDEADSEPPIAGDLSPSERTMLRNLLHFGDRTAGDICVPRGEIVAVDAAASFDDIVAAFAEAEHSRLPIKAGSLDDIVGMIHIKDLFQAKVGSRSQAIETLMRTPLFVPEAMGVLDLLARMRAERTHLAIVVDEHGGTEGLVTIEDVVEEIVGEIEDEHDEQEEAMLVQIGEGRWEADARVELDQINSDVDARLTWDEDDVETIGGLVLAIADRILEPGEAVCHPSGWTLECVDADSKRMTRIRLTAPEPSGE